MGASKAPSRPRLASDTSEPLLAFHLGGRAEDPVLGGRHWPSPLPPLSCNHDDLLVLELGLTSLRQPVAVI